MSDRDKNNAVGSPRWGHQEPGVPRGEPTLKERIVKKRRQRIRNVMMGFGTSNAPGGCLVRKPRDECAAWAKSLFKRYKRWATAHVARDKAYRRDCPEYRNIKSRTFAQYVEWYIRTYSPTYRSRVQRLWNEERRSEGG